MNALTALNASSLRRLIAAAALVAGFAAVSAPARADDTPTTTIGDYTVNTDPSTSSSTDTYGKGDATDTYGKGDATDSTTDGTTTASDTDTYGKG